MVVEVVVVVGLWDGMVSPCADEARACFVGTFGGRTRSRRVVAGGHNHIVGFLCLCYLPLARGFLGEGANV